MTLQSYTLVNFKQITFNLGSVSGFQVFFPAVFTNLSQKLKKPWKGLSSLVYIRGRKWFVDYPFVCLLACSRRSGEMPRWCQEKWAEKKSVRGGEGSKREGTSSLPLFLLIFSRFLTLRHTLMESFRFVDEDDNGYETFSILSTAYAWASVILAGKRDSRRHSMTSFSENAVMAWTGHQM